MRQNVTTLTKKGVTIRYRNEDDLASERGKVLTLGLKEYGRWKMLAVRVAKHGEERRPERATSSMVVGLHFRDGGLTILLLNGDSGAGVCWTDQIGELSGGLAFDRFTNGYFGQTAELVIGRELLTAPRYELSFEVNALGDCLILSEPRPRHEWKEHGRLGRAICVNLSALFAIGPLTVRHDGRVEYEGIEVYRISVGENGEAFPFMKVGNDQFVDSWDLVLRGFERLVHKWQLLDRLQAIDQMYNDDRGGSPEAAAEQFREHLGMLLA